MKKVTYDMQEVTGRLSARIANLELQLAHAEAESGAYAARVEELEAEKATASNEEEEDAG